MLDGLLTADLDYDGEVHRSRTLGQWSNTIGCKMGTCPAGVYTMAKSSLVENFKCGWKNDIAANIAAFFVRGVFQSQDS